MSSALQAWNITMHINKGNVGAVVTVSHDGDKTTVNKIPLVNAQSSEREQVFIGVAADGAAIQMDANSQAINHHDTFLAESYVPYAYPYFDGDTHWYSYDGDKENGEDRQACPSGGAPMLVVRNNGESAEIVKMICLGRGHHVVAFSAPTETDASIPKQAFVSNLLDGNIVVLGNDPADAAHYLQVIKIIDLCEADKEKSGEHCSPNNAFPHGMAFSPLTGKIYSLNNGYASIVVIDPASLEIGSRQQMKKSSNLLLSANGRYLIGKGADRKTDPEHVMGRLSVLDVMSGNTEAALDLPDIYPSTYRFNRDSSKLYVTTAATGKGTQRDNLKMDLLQVYDTSALPEIKLIKEVKVGVADCGRRPLAYIASNDGPDRLFIPNPTDGTLTVLDGAMDEVLETIDIDEGNAKEITFSFWDGEVFGS
ncbi:MAG: hypothetical protein COB71_12475 [Thiotrichales bacterium]|nr:MAG: hypothetical protein COB71_12475 [Thiotrichales bacterium]